MNWLSLLIQKENRLWQNICKESIRFYLKSSLKLLRVDAVLTLAILTPALLALAVMSPTLLTMVFLTPTVSTLTVTRLTLTADNSHLFTHLAHFLHFFFHPHVLQRGVCLRLVHQLDACFTQPLNLSLLLSILCGFCLHNEPSSFIYTTPRYNPTVTTTANDRVLLDDHFIAMIAFQICG